MTKNPCFGCAERYVGCHGECEKYKAWKTEYDRQRELQKEAQKEDDVRNGYVMKSLERYRKKQRKK